MTPEHTDSKPPKAATSPSGQAKAQTNPKKQEHQRLSAAIGSRVMKTLGQPAHLLEVQVRQLWDDRYRVNVYVGADVACAKVANSYFLVVDVDGNILTSTPKITKQY